MAGHYWLLGSSSLGPAGGGYGENWAVACEREWFGLASFNKKTPVAWSRAD